ncbi:MAG: Asr1405/Asl0597 family protein [Leptolyngbyaceae cyanobacterium]
MNNLVSATPIWGLVVSVNRSDRWSIHRRLQELDIASLCPADGTLWVQVNNATDLVLVRSTIRQFLTSRQEDLDWLERCWTTQVLAKADH